MTTIQLQARIECPECALPIPLNGPWLSVHCDNCQNDFELDESYWIGVIKELTSDLHEMKAKPEKMVIFDEYGTNILFCKTKPRCPRCKTIYPEQDGTQEKTFQCGSCGKSATVMPAPEWIGSAIPKVTVLYNATKGQTAADSPYMSKPIVFSCLQCGAALKVDGTSRIVSCSYCDSDNYLPDALWLRLHPASIMTKRYLGLGSKK